MKKYLLSFVLLVLVACGDKGIKLDYTNEQTFENSVASIKKTLPSEQQQKFDSGVYINVITAGLNADKDKKLSLALMMQRISDIQTYFPTLIPYLQAEFKGKSVEEVIKDSEKLPELQLKLMGQMKKP